MSSVQRTAGINGTFTYTLTQVPASAPKMTIYSNPERTVVAVAEATLVGTANPVVFTASYPATLAAGTYYLSFRTTMTTGQPDFVDNDDTLVLVSPSGSVSGACVYAVEADLENRTGTDVSSARANAAIAEASSMIDEYVGGPLCEKTETDRIRGYGKEMMILPGPPTWEVLSVRKEGDTSDLPTTAWALRGTNFLERLDDAKWESNVVYLVRRRRGWAETPAWLKSLTVGIAQRMVYTPDPAVSSERIGDYQVSYRSDYEQKPNLTSREEDVLDMYRYDVGEL